MGKKIFFTGVFIFIFGSIIYLMIPWFSSFIKNDDITLSSNDNNSISQKIPQKIKTSQNKISGELYINFLCPYCRNFYKNTLAPFRKEYFSKVSIQVKNYPFLNEGLEMEMAKFFICAKEQKDQFFILDYFLFGKDEINQMQTKKWISDLKLNPEKMEYCLKTALEKVVAEKKEGKEKGVRGTPTFFLEETKFEGDIEKYKIEMEYFSLKSAKTTF